MKKLLGILILLLIISEFVYLAGLMFGHKCYRELVSQFIKENEMFSYELISHSLFHEEGYLRYKTSKNSSDRNIQKFEFKVDAVFGFDKTGIEISYLNSTYDPLLWDMFSPYVGNVNFTGTYDNFSKTFKGAVVFPELNFINESLLVAVKKLTFSTEYVKQKFYFYTDVSRIRIDFFNSRLLFEDMRLSDNSLAIKYFDFEHVFPDKYKLLMEFENTELHRINRDYLYLENTTAKYSLFDSNENNRLITGMSYNGANADLKVNLHKLLSGYDFFYMNKNHLLEYLADFPMKIYINGGKDTEDQTFDIVYDNVTRLSKQNSEEAVLRLLLGNKLLRLLNLPYLLDVSDEREFVNLTLGHFQIVEIE